MTAGVLTLTVSLAAIAVVYGAASVAVRRRDDAFVRGAGPMLAALAAGVGLVLPAFVMFEPRHAGEAHGVLIPILAIPGAALLAAWMCRAARMVLASRRTIDTWSRCASAVNDPRWEMHAIAIDTGAPVVAVGGLLRPTLYVDRRVLEVCTPAELDAIAAHERAHVTSRDNLKRLLVGAGAGPLSATAAAWRESAEFAADARAARSPSTAVDLAAALIRLSRISTTGTFDSVLVSTIHDGATLEARVRRLIAVEVEAPTTGTRRPFRWLCAVLAIAAAPLLLRSVHQGIEILVRHLP
jgi:Zn-dependent protease with chaperone function